MSRKTVEAALRPIVIRLLMRPSGPTSANIAFCPVETVRDPQGFRHAERAPDGSRFVRDDAVVNWMIHHPWITEDRSIRLNYAFSYRRDLFRFLPFQLQAAGSGQDLGYVVLHVSTEAERTVLKILDCVLVDERHRHDVLRLALREALRWSVDRIECGEEFGPLLDSTHLHRMLTRRETRECLAFTADRAGRHGDRSRELKLRICDGGALCVATPPPPDEEARVMIDVNECPAGLSDSLAQDVPGARQRRRGDSHRLIPRIARCTGL